MAPGRKDHPAWAAGSAHRPAALVDRAYRGVMDLLVVILLVLAVALFLVAGFARYPTDPPRFNFLAFGLAALAFALLIPAYDALK